MSDDKNVWVPPQGFVTKMVDSTPRLVTALIGSFLGVSLSVVIVLKIGGLDNVVIRIANSYASSMEQQVDDLSVQTGKLTALVKQLDNVSDKLASFDTRLRALESKSAENSDAVSLASLEVRTARQGVDRLMLWACTQDVKDRSLGRQILRCEVK